ncbi:DUF6101 family protein [Roseibium aggregatum]|uniref:Uncharacterized protein n=1 Tax=Roseibium aggregatum TaxID=187304 RepID=A0A926P2U2_9HYPH|nr:DUF6101 family protein [Roseibium aggregatum]MBD1546086.1 hypothetical protein [Roseibium aggregatum]
MGRQTAYEAATAAGASTGFPLDPGRLPLTFQSKAGTFSGSHPDVRAVEVNLDRERAMINPVASEAPAGTVVPVKAFDGVMVQLAPADQNGTVCAKLILKHPNDGLSVLLAETGNPEELAAIWPAWSKSLGLPMLVCDLGGKVKPIEAYSARPAAGPSPRRKLALLTGRRPRFLVRRKTGADATARMIHRGEREIIART